MTNKLAQAVALIALSIALLSPMHTVHASTLDNQSTSKTCGVGYVKKGKKCVAIGITQNKELSRWFWCLSKGGTAKQIRACFTHK